MTRKTETILASWGVGLCLSLVGACAKPPRHGVQQAPRVAAVAVDDLVWSPQKKWLPDHDDSLRVSHLVDGDVDFPRRVVLTNSAPPAELLAVKTPLRVAVGEYVELHTDKHAVLAIGARGRAAQVSWGIDTVWLRGVKPGPSTLVAILADSSRREISVEVNPRAPSTADFDLDAACAGRAAIFTAREEALLAEAERSEQSDLLAKAATIRSQRRQRLARACERRRGH